MLGFAPDSVVGPGGDFPLQSPQPASLDEWLRRARVNNPSARAAREVVSVAQAELDQAKSEYWPTVSLVASYSNADSENRSEEHTYELQSLMRISYAVFCLKT